MNPVAILFAVGNGLMTIGSVIALGKKVHYFGKRVQYHNAHTSQPQKVNYTRNNSNQSQGVSKR